MKRVRSTFTGREERTGSSPPHIYTCELTAEAPDPAALPDVSDRLILLNLQISSPSGNLRLQVTAVR